MARFKNFSVWRGRLPHWRADDVIYYVTFRHSRPLDEHERSILFTQLLKPDAKKYDLLILCVLPERSELVFRVLEGKDGPIELSDVVERAKTRAGKLILKRTEERFPPFYKESYDRIVRDEAELNSRLEDILNAPEREGLQEEPYSTLWVRDSSA